MKKNEKNLETTTVTREHFYTTKMFISFIAYSLAAAAVFCIKVLTWIEVPTSVMWAIVAAFCGIVTMLPGNIVSDEFRDCAFIAGIGISGIGLWLVLMPFILF